MKRKSIFFTIIMLFLISSCTTLFHQYDKILFHQYDNWLKNEYQAKTYETALFEKIKKQYKNCIDFDDNDQLRFTDSLGIIEDGYHFYQAEAGQEYQNIDFSIPVPQVQKIAICLNATAEPEFIEVLSGSKETEEIVLRTTGEEEYRFAADTWVLLEFMKDRENTKVYVNRRLKYVKNFPMSRFTIFYFNRGSAKIDYILFE